MMHPYLLKCQRPGQVPMTHTIDIMEVNEVGVLLVGESSDTQLISLERELKKCGKTPFWLHTNPIDGLLPNVVISPNIPDFTVSPRVGSKYSSNQIDWVVIRGLPEQGKDMPTDEWRKSIDGILEILISENVNFIPGKPEAIAKANNKISILRTMIECGFQVPASIVANTDNSIVRTLSHDVVLKPMRDHRKGSGSSSKTIYVNRTNLDNLLKKLGDQFKGSSPVLIQETMIGENIRSLVSEKFHISISYTSGTQHIDSRYYDFSKIRASFCDLPENIAEKCRLLLFKLRLNVAAFDFIKKENQYILLDINPTGLFSGFETLLESNIMSKNYASLVEGIRKSKDSSVVLNGSIFEKKYSCPEREKRENLGISAAGEIDPEYREIFKFENSRLYSQKMDALTIENLSLDLLSDFCNFMARLNGEGLYHGDIRPEHLRCHSGEKIILIDWERYCSFNFKEQFWNSPPIRGHWGYAHPKSLTSPQKYGESMEVFSFLVSILELANGKKFRDPSNFSNAQDFFEYCCLLNSEENLQLDKKSELSSIFEQNPKSWNELSTIIGQFHEPRSIN